MSVRRLVVCMLAVVAIAIVNIYYHALCVHFGYELGRLQAIGARLRVSINALEGRVTMLASPARLKSENERLKKENEGLRVIISGKTFYCQSCADKEKENLEQQR